MPRKHCRRQWLVLHRVSEALANRPFCRVSRQLRQRSAADYLFLSGGGLSSLITSQGRAVIFSFSRSYFARSALSCSRWELSSFCGSHPVQPVSSAATFVASAATMAALNNLKKLFIPQYSSFSRCEVSYIWSHRRVRPAPYSERASGWLRNHFAPRSESANFGSNMRALSSMNALPTVEPRV
jgi:hypothetical protein